MRTRFGVGYSRGQSNRRNAEIIRQVQRGMSFSEIARRLGISRERVRQIYHTHVSRTMTTYDRRIHAHRRAVIVLAKEFRISQAQVRQMFQRYLEVVQ